MGCEGCDVHFLNLAKGCYNDDSASLEVFRQHCVIPRTVICPTCDRECRYRPSKCTFFVIRRNASTTSLNTQDCSTNIPMPINKNVSIHHEDNCLKLRTNAKSREEIQRWLEIFYLKTSTCLSSYKLYPVGTRKLFRQRLCHNGVKHKGVKKHLQDSPTSEAHGSPHQLIFAQTKQKNIEGMTTAQAHRRHLMKMALGDDLYGQANHAINLSPRTIQYMRDTWMKKEHGGLNTPYMFEATKKYAKDNPEVTLKIEHDESCFCVVLITPFMKRAHTQLRESGEVVFVDATSALTSHTQQ